MMEPWQIDAIWLSIAFLAGLLAKKVNLPPLIGFLATGFLLNISGFTQGHISNIIHTLSDLGVMLLLFTIGLKIKLKSLAQREIWATAGIHMILSVIAISSFIFILSFLGLRQFSDISYQSALLIGFALSFSSTVFVVKILEERGELNSFHGKIAIGILVIQDIFAVIYITLSKNQLPTAWIFALPLFLYVVRFVLYRLLDFSGHGELLTIFGFFATFIIGALSFEIAGLKADLGALVIGMLLVGHPKSKELYERMMEYKDFFLVAFFISIGLSGIPNMNSLLITLLLLGFILFKGVLFVFILSRQNLRGRTAFLTSISLANYSEFSLIVGMAALKTGLINNEWLVAIALLMSVSFLISSPLNYFAHDIYDKVKPTIMKLNIQAKYRKIDDAPIAFGDVNYMVIGLGTIGYPAFRHIDELYPGKVIGIDYSHEKIKHLQDENKNVLWGDSTDIVFWENVNCSGIQMVLLAMSEFHSDLNSMKEILKLKNRQFKVAAMYHYEDEKEELLKQKVDYIYSYKERLGIEFAESFLHECKSD
jgi:glutathione-regulated potassium-efflux system ancillary protein KefC